MFSCSQKLLCLAIVLLLALDPVVYSQQTGAAPVPPQVLHARAVFVSNAGGTNYFEIFTGGPDRGYNTLYADLKREQQYELVSSPSEADLIFEIRSIAPAAAGAAGTDQVTVNPQLILNIRDPRTQAILWTTTANVRVFGTKKRRDRQFDDAVAVLLDKVEQITGRPLSPEKTKAVRANSHMPSAAKVLLAVSIGAAVALTAYGIYRVTHPPTPAVPSLP